MSSVLVLLAVLGSLGSFDTLYYHEWRGHLPAQGAGINSELRLHAARDFVYVIVFGTLPWVAWQGAWSAVLGGLLAIEVVITLCDFVLEDRVRAPLGGVFAGERVTHALMAIVYGAMLAHLTPVLGSWWHAPSHLMASRPAVPVALRTMLLAMAVGIFFSGWRDLYASFEIPSSTWPWTRASSSATGPT